MHMGIPSLKALLGLGVSVTLLGGCDATQPMEIPAANVSAEQFAPYSCNQLSAEYRRAQGIAQQMESELKRRADQDEALTSVWAVTGIQLGGLKYGDGPMTQEYAELKGTMAALETAMISKDCNNLPF